MYINDADMLVIKNYQYAYSLSNDDAIIKKITLLNFTIKGLFKL